MNSGNPEILLTEQEYILRAKKEWEQTFDAVSDLIFIVDNDYTIVRANRAMAERSGLTTKELVGRNCYEVIHGKNFIPDNCLHADLKNCATTQTTEIVMEALNGTFQVTLSPLFNSEGQRTATVHIARDITEKVRIEKALQESEQRFSLFMEHLPLAVFIKDECGRVLFANEYLKDLLHVECLKGLTFNDLLPAEVTQKMSHDDHEARTQGLGLYKDIFNDATGQEKIFDTYKFPIPCADGTTLLGGISVDVTEKRRQEALLAAQQYQLVEVNNTLEYRIRETVAEMRRKDAILIQESRLSAMGEMISNIAHQWRQPLNNIGLIVQSLQLAFKANDLTVEELDADIADAMNVLQQISATIDDFRNFFRHEREPSTFCVNEVVVRSLSMAGSSLKSCGIGIAMEEQPDVTAQGYPNEYAQAFLNIIMNARDALLDRHVHEPLITIRISEEKGRSVVIIRDNGGGISGDVLPKIFDPYFSTKLQGKGSGVGLYMAKMIIEKHMYGRLTVHSAEDWSEFRVEV